MAESIDAVVVTESPLWNVPWFAYCVEFERVIASVLDADTIEISRRPGTVPKLLADRHRARNLSKRVKSLRSFDWNAGEKHYDLAVIVVSDLNQLGVLAAIPGWRSIADRFIAYVFEVWPVWLPAAAGAFTDVIDHLDHVFVGLEKVIPHMQALTKTPVSFVPCGVDVLQVKPPTSIEGKRVDVSNRGRRDKGQHQMLVQWAAANDKFYEYDTGGLANVESPDGHRRHFYEQAARSRAFVANLARLDQADLRGGVAEVGLRYYEAVACGSVLIGEHPPRDMIERSLGNPPGLFDLPGGCTSMPGDIGEMLTDDRAVIDLGVANRRVGLQHLDVSHRWDVMASALGLGDTTGVVARRAALAAELAELASLA